MEIGIPGWKYKNYSMGGNETVRWNQELLDGSRPISDLLNGNVTLLWNVNSWMEMETLGQKWELLDGTGNFWMEMDVER